MVHLYTAITFPNPHSTSPLLLLDSHISLVCFQSYVIVFTSIFYPSSEFSRVTSCLIRLCKTQGIHSFVQQVFKYVLSPRHQIQTGTKYIA